MGKLKPGATYVYERDGNTVYAREAGADPSTRVEVGYDFDAYEERRDADIRAGMKKRRDDIMEDQLWQDIVAAAETNVALQDLLDQVKMMYKLTKIK